jgi:hypothetical protein
LKVLKKRYFSFIALTIILSMLILATGCGVRINGHDYELFKATEEDSDDIWSAVGSESGKNQNISENRDEAEQFVLPTGNGNVEIKKSTGSQIGIKADKKVRGSSSKNKNTVIENMNIVLERDGNVVKVVVKTKDGNDFWDWRKENYASITATVNYEISLPDGINAVEVSIGVGNIDVKDISAKLTLNTGAGNIDMRNVTAIEDNLLDTGAGNIEFEGTIDNISSFEASTGAGNVELKVPEATKMSLEADTGIGNLSGYFIEDNHDKFHFEDDINGGGPDVKLDTGVGNVEVDKN